METGRVSGDGALPGVSGRSASTDKLFELSQTQREHRRSLFSFPPPIDHVQFPISQISEGGSLPSPPPSTHETNAEPLLHHHREVHKKNSTAKATLFCPDINCNRHTGQGFTRRENLNEHIRRRHVSQPGLEGQQSPTVTTGLRARTTPPKYEADSFRKRKKTMDLEVETRDKEGEEQEDADFNDSGLADTEDLRKRIKVEAAESGRPDRDYSQLQQAYHELRLQLQESNRVLTECQQNSRPANLIESNEYESAQLMADPQSRGCPQLLALDPEPTFSARVSSEREPTSSATISLASSLLTTCDVPQTLHSSAQAPPYMTVTNTVHRPSKLPILGCPSVQDGRDSTSPDPLSPPLQSCSQEPFLGSATLSAKCSSQFSDTSSFDWADDGRDPAQLRLFFVSCSVLLRAYLRLADKTVSSGSEQQDADGQTQAKNRAARQQSSQVATNIRKRKQNSSRDESEDGNDQAHPKRQRSDSKSPVAFEVRPLACPFNKYDNRLFGPESPDEAYHVCATCSFVNTAHLKQHLQRNHYLPRYFCFRCCRRNFSSQAMLASHQREQPMCEPLDPPLYRERIGIDMIEELGLERKNVTGTDRVEYWHKVYDTFFPGAAEIRPVSPYYEGPAADHLHRFLLFSEQVFEELLPIVQERLGLQENFSPNSQLRLQQEIQQEAGQRYLQHIASSSMPHLGRRFPNSDANTSSNAGPNLVSQVDLSAPGEVPFSFRRDTAVQDSNRVNIQVAPSNGSGSMTPASSMSSSNLPQTPIVGLSKPIQADPIPPKSQMTFDHALGDGARPAELGAPSQDFGANAQSLHSHNYEQPEEPFGWLADINFDWDSEINAAAVAYDSENPLAKDQNDTTTGRYELGLATWQERSTSPRFAM